MNDAPEQIWVDATNSWATVSLVCKPDRTPYTRTDLTPQWQPIETAPKDGTVILAICTNSCSGPCGYSGAEHETKLCLYHAHAEGLSATDDGYALVQWGGGWSDCCEDGGGYMPDFWFVHDSEFEKVANPTHWMPLPPLPSD